MKDKKHDMKICPKIVCWFEDCNVQIVSKYIMPNLV